MDINFSIEQVQECNFAIQAVICETISSLDGMTITDNATYGTLETQTI